MSAVYFNVPGQKYSMLRYENGFPAEQYIQKIEGVAGLRRFSNEMFKVGNARAASNLMHFDVDYGEFSQGMIDLMAAMRLKSKTAYKSLEAVLQETTQLARQLAPRQTEEGHRKDKRYGRMPHLDESIFYILAPNGYGIITVDERIKYAALQHEVPFTHTIKGQWKYIETAILAQKDRILQAGAEALQEIYNSVPPRSRGGYRSRERSARRTASRMFYRDEGILNEL